MLIKQQLLVEYFAIFLNNISNNFCLNLKSQKIFKKFFYFRNSWLNFFWKLLEIFFRLTKNKEKNIIFALLIKNFYFSLLILFFFTQRNVKFKRETKEFCGKFIRSISKQRQRGCQVTNTAKKVSFYVLKV